MRTLDPTRLQPVVNERLTALLKKYADRVRRRGKHLEVRSPNPLTAPPGVPALRHEAHYLRLNRHCANRKTRANQVGGP